MNIKEAREIRQLMRIILKDGMNDIIFGRVNEIERKYNAYLVDLDVIAASVTQGYEQGVRNAAKISEDAVITTTFPDGTTEHREVGRRAIAKAILSLLEGKE